jgi:hypothetical protein
VRDFLARVVHEFSGRLSGLFRTFAHASSSRTTAMFNCFKAMLGPLGSFLGDCLSTFANLGYGTFRRCHPSFPSFFTSSQAD